jgi:hypothetical protein
VSKPSGWHRKRKNTAAERARAAQYASPEHRAVRRAMAADVAAGRAVCCRCWRPILPGTSWHADHNKARTGYLGPAHASCNLSAAAVEGARRRNGGSGPTRVRL